MDEGEGFLEKLVDDVWEVVASLQSFGSSVWIERRGGTGITMWRFGEWGRRGVVFRLVTHGSFGSVVSVPCRI